MLKTEIELIAWGVLHGHYAPSFAATLILDLIEKDKEAVEEYDDILKQSKSYPVNRECDGK